LGSGCDIWLACFPGFICLWVGVTGFSCFVFHRKTKNAFLSTGNECLAEMAANTRPYGIPDIDGSATGLSGYRRNAVCYPANSI
jgi:hypothetical protein